MTPQVAHDPRTHRIVLVRHGQTEWSLARRHTGRTDIGLTDRGRSEAMALAEPLAKWEFGLVLVSPLARAHETARLAGLLDRIADIEVCDNLIEWDYGAYEGLTTAEIRTQRPGWEVFRDGCPQGEDPAAVSARADQVLQRIDDWNKAGSGDVAVVAHAHLLRVLAARWMTMEASFGRHLGLDSGSYSILDHERETPIIKSWNQPTEPT